MIIQWPQTSTQCQVPQKFQMRPCRELITFIRGFCHVKLVQKSSGAAWLGSRARKVGCSVTPLSKVLSYRQGWNQDTERQNWMEGRWEMDYAGWLEADRFGEIPRLGRSET